MLTLKLTPEEQVALAEALDFTFSVGAVKSIEGARPLIRIREQLSTPEAAKFKAEAIQRREAQVKGGVR